MEQTEVFARWHAGLRDLRARIAIARRIERVAAGNPGDTKPVGGGVSELRIAMGLGYRVLLHLAPRSGGDFALWGRQGQPESRYQAGTTIGSGAMT